MHVFVCVCMRGREWKLMPASLRKRELFLRLASLRWECNRKISVYCPFCSHFSIYNITSERIFRDCMLLLGKTVWLVWVWSLHGPSMLGNFSVRVRKSSMSSLSLVRLLTEVFTSQEMNKNGEVSSLAVFFPFSLSLLLCHGRQPSA